MVAACRSPIPPLGCVFSFFLSFSKKEYVSVFLFLCCCRASRGSGFSLFGVLLWAGRIPLPTWKRVTPHPHPVCLDLPTIHLSIPHPPHPVSAQRSLMLELSSRLAGSRAGLRKTNSRALALQVLQVRTRFSHSREVTSLAVEALRARGSRSRLVPVVLCTEHIRQRVRCAGVAASARPCLISLGTLTENKKR